MMVGRMSDVKPGRECVMKSGALGRCRGKVMYEAHFYTYENFEDLDTEAKVHTEPACERHFLSLEFGLRAMECPVCEQEFAFNIPALIGDIPLVSCPYCGSVVLGVGLGPDDRERIRTALRRRRSLGSVLKRAVRSVTGSRMPRANAPPPLDEAVPVPETAPEQPMAVQDAPVRVETEGFLLTPEQRKLLKDAGEFYKWADETYGDGDGSEAGAVDNSLPQSRDERPEIVLDSGGPPSVEPPSSSPLDELLYRQIHVPLGPILRVGGALVAVAGFVMATLVLLARAGIYFEPARALWSPVIGDVEKVALGYGAVGLFLLLRRIYSPRKEPKAREEPALVLEEEPESEPEVEPADRETIDATLQELFGEAK